jgi:alcohol dehydrogenase, propanol-preferring
MKAMVLEAPGRPLRAVERPAPEPGPADVVVQVRACGVCRTDLHIADGELTGGALPIIPGHQIVGEVVGVGRDADGFEPGRRVGIPWLGWTCGACPYCREGHENLCDRARFTGFHRDGGFAELAVADARYVFPLDDPSSDLECAPLLCAGVIGFRAYRIAERDGPELRRIGLYGFGAAAHILTQVATFEGREVFAFTRPGDDRGQAFARRLGAAWAGPSDQPPPEPLDAAILFAPVGALVPRALAAVRKRGVVVCGGIHMSDIPAFPYHALWGERAVRSVANLTRADAREFLDLAPRVPVRTRVHAYELHQAGRALDDVRSGRTEGAAVLAIGPVTRETTTPMDP